jgi:hypothetical protein
MPIIKLIKKNSISLNDGRLNGGTHETFEKISQSEREDWLHSTVADRHSDPYFGSDISSAWLYVTAIPVITTHCIHPYFCGKQYFLRYEAASYEAPHETYEC